MVSGFFLLLVMIMISMAAIFSPLQADAASIISLPQSGQAKCYNTSGAVSLCAGTGQDGEQQTGIEWPSPRFSDNGNSTVTDNLTGLIWLKDANCIKTKYPAINSSGVVSWYGALEFIDGINQGTYSDCSGGIFDWRLPNANEIQSLVHAGFTEELCSGIPCQYLKNWLETQGFLNVQVGDLIAYWTSTTATDTFDICDSCSATAYVIDMRGGRIATASKLGQPEFVLPVRGGIPPAGPAKLWATGQTLCFDNNGPIDCTSQGRTQDGAVKAGVSWTAPRVIGNPDGTVSDPLTGLMWLKDSNCMKTNYPAVANNGLVTWNSGLLFIKGINNGTYPLCESGYRDWRMPNIVEFHSLYSYYMTNPALPQGHPFENIEIFSWENSNKALFWTSTSYSGNTLYAFEANATAGTFNTTLKSTGRAVWPVRGGCAIMEAKLGETTYSHIQDAYNAVTANNQTVQMQATIFTENLVLALPYSVILRGGYECGYASNPGWTTIQGSLSISSGTVTIENLIVQ